MREGLNYIKFFDLASPTELERAVMSFIDETGALIKSFERSKGRWVCLYEHRSVSVDKRIDEILPPLGILGEAQKMWQEREVIRDPRTVRQNEACPIVDGFVRDEKGELKPVRVMAGQFPVGAGQKLHPDDSEPAPLVLMGPKADLSRYKGVIFNG